MSVLLSLTLTGCSGEPTDRPTGAAGSGLDVAGDMDGDGLPELVIDPRGGGEGGTLTGKAWIVPNPMR